MQRQPFLREIMEFREDEKHRKSPTWRKPNHLQRSSEGKQRCHQPRGRQRRLWSLREKHRKRESGVGGQGVGRGKGGRLVQIFPGTVSMVCTEVQSKQREGRKSPEKGHSRRAHPSYTG
ncbi:hypothetical protein FKM82_009710 [Ascaphus truei]